MSRPLSWSMRFALALSAVFAIGTLSASGLSYVFLSREMHKRLSSDVRSHAETLAQFARNSDLAALDEQITAQMRAIRDGSSLVAFIDAVSGKTIGSLHPKAPFEGERRLVVGKDILDGASAATDRPEAYLAYGVHTDLGWIITARDEAWVTENGEILVQTMTWSLASGLFLSIGLALFIARRNERRIDAMERVLDGVGAGRMHMRIRDPGDDDLAEVASRVDDMLNRLEAGVDAIRQVSTDVAHDLRAPLARLRMRLEPQALSPDLPEEARHEIGSALIDLDAISATFDAILRLARLQTGTAEHRSVPVDLVHVAAEVIDLLGPSAQDAGHTLTARLPASPVIVTGDADLLTQALTNLIDNALRYCPPPANVTVEVAVPDRQPVLAVSDDGPGIAEGDRNRVLERFVRLEPSRSVAGTGLGLSLVAAIAALHGAALALADNEPGLRVSLTFPPEG